jgi:hypothetical protein
MRIETNADPQHWHSLRSGKREISILLKLLFLAIIFLVTKTTIKICCTSITLQNAEFRGNLRFCRSSIANLFLSREFIVLRNVVRKPCSKWGQLYSLIFLYFAE